MKVLLSSVVLVALCVTSTSGRRADAAEVNASLLEDGSKFADRLVKVISAHDADAAQIAKMLSPLKKAGEFYAKMALPSSMVSQKQLEALENDVTRLNSIGTTAPAPLASTESIRSIAMAGGAGTPTDTPQQLARYKAAGLARESQIRRVVDNRDRLAKSLVQMRKDAATAEAVNQKLEQLIDKPQLEVIARITGKSFVMSVIDYSSVIVPAFENRVTSGEAALKRLDKIASEMTTDLNAYRQALVGTAWLFGDVSRLPPARPPAPGQEQSAAVVYDTQKLNKSLAQAQVAAQALRDEARAIAERNAPLNALSSLLEIGSTGLAVAGAVSGSGQPTAESAGKPAAPSHVSPSPTTRIRLTASGRSWIEVVAPDSPPTRQPLVKIRKP